MCILTPPQNISFWNLGGRIFHQTQAPATRAIDTRHCSACSHLFKKERSTKRAEHSSWRYFPRALAATPGRQIRQVIQMGFFALRKTGEMGFRPPQKKAKCTCRRFPSSLQTERDCRHRRSKKSQKAETVSPQGSSAAESLEGSHGSQKGVTVYVSLCAC